MSGERYTFPGTPLTPQEDEALKLVIEECAEVIQAATKVQRFGKEYYPGYGDNQQQLGLEVGDLEACLDRARSLALFSPTDVQAGRERKGIRLGKYLKYP